MGTPTLGNPQISRWFMNQPEFTISPDVWPAGLLVLLQLSRANAQMVAKYPDAITRLQMESKGLRMHYFLYLLVIIYNIHIVQTYTNKIGCFFVRRPYSDWIRQISWAPTVQRNKKWHSVFSGVGGLGQQVPSVKAFASFGSKLRIHCISLQFGELKNNTKTCRGFRFALGVRKVDLMSFM